MRNNHHLHFHSEPNNNANNPSCSIERSQLSSPSCNVSSRNSFIRASNYEFNFCIWRSCEGSQGGAIYLSVSSSEATLTVSHCEFHNCNASCEGEDLSEGGAIYANQIGEVTVEHSPFASCHAEYAGNNGGGGIQMFSIQTQSIVTDCFFSHCSSAQDGGGISNRFSYALNKEMICISCFFTNNEAKGDGGGAFEFWEFHNPIGCTNSLFNSNKATRGGAMSIGNFSIATPNTLITFCFYNHNDGSGYGNDYCTHPDISDSPFLHSFTTTELNRSCYFDYGWSAYPLDNNWLPHAGNSVLWCEIQS